MNKNTYIYIDGLNFYYGLVKNSPYKWLDLKSLFVKVLPKDFNIRKIKYFTAKVKAFPTDPQAPHRQAIYLRALEKWIPEIEIFYGSFLINVKKRRLENSILDVNGNAITETNVIVPEEKGSDVNLAVHLLNDAWLDHYDWAVVVSNDSDLSESLRLTRANCGKKILLIPTISPQSGIRKPTFQLNKNADKMLMIRQSSLANSQLPSVIPGTNIHKPSTWS